MPLATDEEFKRIKEIQNAAREEEKRKEDARQWKKIQTIHCDDDSVKEVYEEKDGNRKTVFNLCPKSKRRYGDGYYDDPFYSNPMNYREYPQKRNHPEQSAGQIVLKAALTAFNSFSSCRTFAFLKKALILAHIFSIGFKSGLYGGR